MAEQSANRLQYAGEYTLEGLELRTVRGNFNITRNYVQLDLFENIFSNSISGSLVIADTNNLIVNVPFIGQEFLRLKISTPGISGIDAIDYQQNYFVVYKVGFVQDISKGTQLIELHFTTQEALLNQRVRVSKSYSQDNLHEIVEDVLVSGAYLDSRKYVFLEKAKNLQRIVSPNLHPFDLIAMCSSQAQSSSSSTDPDINYFVFFENTRGYHFKSLSFLYKQPIQGEYNCGDVGTIDRKTEDKENYNRVLTYNKMGSINMLENIVGGVLGSTLTTHDIYNKKYEEYSHGYFDSYPRVDENPIYLNTAVGYSGRNVGDFADARIYLNSRSGENSNKSFSRGTNDTGDEGNVSSLTKGTGLLRRRAKFAELNGGGGTNYNIKVNGHVGMKAGQIINFTVSTVGNPHGQGSENKYTSGRYLVTHLRHTFFRAPTVKHEVTMAITKDSYRTSLPSGSIETTTRPRGFVTEVTYGGDYGGM